MAVAKIEKLNNTETYVVRKEKVDPCVFHLNEKYGLITIHYWTHAWHSYWMRPGRGDDTLKHFLQRCDDHYLMKNFEKGERCLDINRIYKEMMKEYKKRKDSISEQYELEEALREIESMDEKDDGRFQAVVFASPIYGKLYGDPMDIPCHKKFSRELEHVFKHYWKPFMRLLKKEEEKRCYQEKLSQAVPQAPVQTVKPNSNSPSTNPPPATT